MSWPECRRWAQRAKYRAEILGCQQLGPISDSRKQQFAAEATTLTREHAGYSALAREHQGFAATLQSELSSYTEPEIPEMPSMRRVDTDTNPTDNLMTIADIEQQAEKLNALLVSPRPAAHSSSPRRDTEDTDGQDGDSAGQEHGQSASHGVSTASSSSAASTSGAAPIRTSGTELWGKGSHGLPASWLDAPLSSLA